MKSFKQYLVESVLDHARKLGDQLSVDWDKIDIKEFMMGLSVEREHDTNDELDVIKSELDIAKIALAHLKEKPNYYTLLKKVEEDAVVNSVGTGAIAGTVGDPPIFPKKKKKN